MHDSGHEKWNTEVREALATIEKQLETEGLSPGSDAYAMRARELLETLQDKLRDKLQEHDRLNWVVPTHAGSFA